VARQRDVRWGRSLLNDCIYCGLCVLDSIVYMLYIFLSFSVHCHSLTVRLVNHLSGSQSPAAFTTSSAYTASTARPSLHETPQEGANCPYRDTTAMVGWLSSRVVRCRRARVRVAATTLSGNSLRQTVHTHRASVHQAAKLVAAILRVAWVTAGLAESNGRLPPGL